MKKLLALTGIFSLFVSLLFLGCEGNTGPQGPPGQSGSNVVVVAQPESCEICHNGEFARNGETHQAIYDEYADASSFAVTIDSVSSVDNGTVGFYNVTMQFTITQNGQPYIDVVGLPSLDQARFFAVLYDNTTRQFDNAVSSWSDPTPTGTAGQYSVTALGTTYAPELSNAQVYMYIAKGELETESPGNIHMYADVTNAGQAFGNAGTYISAANVAGCEKCHGTPYMKHGYRAASVPGLADFASCKDCHYDSRDGGHLLWQLLVDDPQLAAAEAAADEADTTILTPEQETYYAYKARIMNDVHMSHSMEFPYPQSMATCVTCHEGKLNQVLTDDNFVIQTCRSCHPVNGGTDLPDADGDFTVDTRTTNGEKSELNKQAPALVGLLPTPEFIEAHNPPFTVACNGCHNGTDNIGPVFSQIHTGYDDKIYTPDGVKYSEAFTVTIDNASFVGNQLTIAFSATEDPDIPGLAVTDITPYVLVGLYGYNTKDIIVNPHDRDEDRNRLLEYAVDNVTVNPRFTVLTAAGGSWEVIADLSMWADMIAAGTVKKAEIAILPRFIINGENPDLALIASSKTFDFSANAFVDNYFKGANAIVKVDTGCNNCHDVLATTWHVGDGRGGKIEVCRLCHAKPNPGSHLEMQSRSIVSYVHSIHSFQAFDIGDIDFTDPVEALHYKERTEEFVFPNFTILNCEACHTDAAGVFDVPDQSESLPGVLSGSDFPVIFPDGLQRNIGDVPSYITGPAAVACGACHRAHEINEDNAGGLASLFSHWRTFGYLIEAGDPPYDIFTVIDDIFSNL